MSKELSYTEERNALREEILELISWHQEGEYWDFKKQWYEHNKNGKIKLLHDIICMANNLANKDAYIIIGVDEGQDHLVVGVDKDKNRWNTQNIIDFLKNKKFVGDVRPIVRVETMYLFDGIDIPIDVIIIRNSHNTPFYLKEQFEEVNANYIYTRVGDTNTPINNSADINHVEYLWRKRFHLDETPLEKFGYYLQQTDLWEGYLENGVECRYFKEHPEYRIREDIDNDRDATEFYMLLYQDKRPHWNIAKFYYHQTMLKEILYNSLDGGGCYVALPEQRGFSFGDNFWWDISYYSYCKNSLEYGFLYFLLKVHDQLNSYQIALFKKVILFFDNELERINFENYAKNNKTRYEELYKQEINNPVPWGSYKVKEYDTMENLEKQYHNAFVLQKMLVEFREKRDKLIVSA